MLPLPRGAVWQIFFLLCAVLLANEVRSEGRVVCYYTNWSVYRPGTAKFNPQNINPYLCTHLIYAFGGFTKDNTMKPFDKYQDIEQGGYAKFTGLKTYNKQLKTMIAIGGWNEASSRFSPLVASPERRQQFIKNILKFLRQNHFDGLDLDWEYPAHRDGGKPRDKDNYAQFVQELRAEFDRESTKTGRPRLLLTMAVPAGIQYIEKGYDIPKLNKYLDWFNMLTYDFHSSHEPSANHHAPLYSLEAEDEYNFDSDLNIDYSVKYYLDAGADRDKLVLGIPTYGRSYTLFNEDSTDLGAPADGPGEQGDATREKGYLAYYEICQNLKEDPDWHVVQPNPKAMGPYAYKGNQWVGYDDEDIVRKKAEYVAEHGLGGIMFWAIDNDDFRGTCTGKPYPLIEAAKETYLDRLGLGDNEVAKPSSKKKPLRSRSRIGSSNRNKVEEVVEKAVSNSRKRPATRKRPQTERQTTTTTTTSSSLYIGGRTTTPQPPTTPDPGSDFKCEDEGFFQHPRDCKKYFWCLDSGPSNLGIVAHQFTCPSGLYFNPSADSCDFARNVPCNKNPKEAPSTTAKPKTTTTTTTARTTTASSRITAATSRNTFSRFTSTTEEPDDDEEEYEDEVDDVGVDAEEDPKVIKELIDLIKKVGGIEELEKHILLQQDGTVMLKKDESSSSGGTTTPASISKSLYDKVLSRPNNLSAFRNKFTSSTLFRSTSKPKTVQVEEEEDVEDSNSGSKYSSVVRNSRPGPQNAGIDKLPEFDGLLKEKKKYVTIQRTKPTTTEVDEDADEKANIQNDEDEEDEDEEVAVSTTRRPSTSPTPSYVSIRRTKPTTVSTTDVAEDEKEVDATTEKKSYVPLNRNRGRSTTEAVEVETTTVVAGNRYKFLERTRPTRRPTVTEAPKDEIDEESAESEDPVSVTVQYTETNEVSTQSPTQQPQTTARTYASIGRRTTTTTPSSTTTLPASITTTTPESFVIDTTTPEPIIITTTATSTTTITNPTSTEISINSSTITTPIPTSPASTSIPSLSQDGENATIAPKIPNSLATESGLDTQELDSTKNQILTETTTIDDTNRNEVTNQSDTSTITSDKSQSSLDNDISSNSRNSTRGTPTNRITGGSRRQQQNQRRTTTTTIATTTTDTNQRQETSPITNDFLGTVSSPRPFGFPRRRTRPTTTKPTSSNGSDDADALSTRPTSDSATPTLVKKVSSTQESYLRSRSRLSQDLDRTQNGNGDSSLVVVNKVVVVDSMVKGTENSEDDVSTKTQSYSWKDARNPNLQSTNVAQGERRDDEGLSQSGGWQSNGDQTLSSAINVRDGDGAGLGLNGFDRFANKFNSGKYSPGSETGKWVHTDDNLDVNYDDGRYRVQLDDAQQSKDLIYRGWNGHSRAQLIRGEDDGQDTTSAASVGERRNLGYSIGTQNSITGSEGESLRSRILKRLQGASSEEKQSSGRKIVQSSFNGGTLSRTEEKSQNLENEKTESLSRESLQANKQDAGDDELEVEISVLDSDLEAFDRERSRNRHALAAEEGLQAKSDLDEISKDSKKLLQTSSQYESNESIRNRNELKLTPQNQSQANIQLKSQSNYSQAQGRTRLLNSSSTNSSVTQSSEAQIENARRNLGNSRRVSNFAFGQSQQGVTYNKNTATSSRGNISYGTVQSAGVSKVQSENTITSDRGNILFNTTNEEAPSASAITTPVDASRGDVLYNSRQTGEASDEANNSITSDRGNLSYNIANSSDSVQYNSSHHKSSTTLLETAILKGESIIGLARLGGAGSGEQNSTATELDSSSKAQAVTVSEAKDDLDPTSLENSTSSANVTLKSDQILNSTKIESTNDSKIRFSDRGLNKTVASESDAILVSQDQDATSLSMNRTEIRLESANGGSVRKVTQILKRRRPVVVKEQNDTSSEDRTRIRFGSSNRFVFNETQTTGSRNTVNSFKFGSRDATLRRIKNKNTSNIEAETNTDLISEADNDTESNDDTTVTASTVPATFTSRSRLSGSARKSYVRPSSQEVTRSNPRAFSFTTRNQIRSQTNSEDGTKQSVAEAGAENDESVYYEATTTTTRRPRVVDRGSFRPKFNDLSSLLAIDFHKHQKTLTETEAPREVVRRRRPTVQRTTTEPAEDEEATTRQPRPTRPPRTTTTTEKPEPTIRPTSSRRRIESTFTRRPLRPDSSDSQTQQGNYALRRKIIRKRIQSDMVTSSGVSSSLNISGMGTEAESLRKDQLAVKNAILNLLGEGPMVNITDGSMLSESEVKVDFDQDSGTKTSAGNRYYNVPTRQEEFSQSSNKRVSSSGTSSSNEATRKQNSKNRYFSTSFGTLNKGADVSEDITTEKVDSVIQTIPRGDSRLNHPDLSSLLSHDVPTRRRLNVTNLVTKQGPVRSISNRTVTETVVSGDGDTATLTETTTRRSFGGVNTSGRNFGIRKTVISPSIIAGEEISSKIETIPKSESGANLSSSTLGTIVTETIEDNVKAAVENQIGGAIQTQTLETNNTEGADGITVQNTRGFSLKKTIIDPSQVSTSDESESASNSSSSGSVTKTVNTQSTVGEGAKVTRVFGTGKTIISPSVITSDESGSASNSSSSESVAKTVNTQSIEGEGAKVTRFFGSRKTIISPSVSTSDVSESASNSSSSGSVTKTVNTQSTEGEGAKVTRVFGSRKTIISPTVSTSEESESASNSSSSGSVAKTVNTQSTEGEGNKVTRVFGNRKTIISPSVSTSDESESASNSSSSGSVAKTVNTQSTVGEGTKVTRVFGTRKTIIRPSVSTSEESESASNSSSSGSVKKTVNTQSTVGEEAKVTRVFGTRKTIISPSISTNDESESASNSSSSRSVAKTVNTQSTDGEGAKTTRVFGTRKTIISPAVSTSDESESASNSTSSGSVAETVNTQSTEGEGTKVKGVTQNEDISSKAGEISASESASNSSSSALGKIAVKTDGTDETQTQVTRGFGLTKTLNSSSSLSTGKNISTSSESESTSNASSSTLGIIVPEIVEDQVKEAVEDQVEKAVQNKTNRTEVAEENSQITEALEKAVEKQKTPNLTKSQVEETLSGAGAPVTEETIITLETGHPRSPFSGRAIQSSSSVQSNELSSEESDKKYDPLVPIYHRRRYYKYLKDSPIIYIGKFGGNNELTGESTKPTTTLDKQEINKAIFEVFDVFNHSRLEAEARNEGKSGNGVEVRPQDNPPNSGKDGSSIAREINTQLDHFLVSAPRTTESLGASEASSTEEILRTTEGKSTILKLAMDVNSMGVVGMDLLLDGSGESSLEVTESSVKDDLERTTVKGGLNSRRSFKNIKAIEINEIAKEDGESESSPTTTRRTPFGFTSAYESSTRRSLSKRPLTATELNEDLSATEISSGSPKEPTANGYRGRTRLTTALKEASDESSKAEGNKQSIESRRILLRNQAASRPKSGDKEEGINETNNSTKTKTHPVPTEETSGARNEDSVKSQTQPRGRSKFVAINEISSKTRAASLDQEADETAESEEADKSLSRQNSISSSWKNEKSTRISEEYIKTEANTKGGQKIASAGETDEVTSITEEELTVIPSLDDFESLTTVLPTAESKLDEETSTKTIELESELSSPETNTIQSTTESHRSSKTFKDYTTENETSKTKVKDAGDVQELVETSESISEDFSSSAQTSLEEFLEGNFEDEEENLSTTSTLSSEYESSTGRGSEGFNRRKPTTTTTNNPEETTDDPVTSPRPTSRTRSGQSRRRPTSIPTPTENEASEDSTETSGTTTNRRLPGINRESHGFSFTSVQGDSNSRKPFTPRGRSGTFSTTEAAQDDSTSTLQRFDKLEKTETQSEDSATERSLRDGNRVRTFGFRKSQELVNKTESQTEAGENEVRPTRPPFGKLNSIRTTTETLQSTSESTEKPEERVTEASSQRIFTRPNYLRTTTEATTESSTTSEIQSVTEIEDSDEATSKRTFSGFSQRRVTTTTDNGDTLPTTRRPFSSINRLRTTTSEPVEISELPKEEASTELEIEVSSTPGSTISSRKSYASLNRIRTTTEALDYSQTTEIPQEEDSNEGEDSSFSPTAATATTRRAFVNLNRIRTTTSAPTEESISENDVESTTSRRTFAGVNRLRTITTESSEILNKNSEKELEESTTGRSATTRRTFGTFNRGGARTTASSELEIEDTKSTSRRTFGGLNRSTTTEALQDDTENESTTRRSYSGINRSRPSTTIASESPQDREVEAESPSTSTRRSYSGFNRSRTTTLAPSEATETEEEVTDEVSENFSEKKISGTTTSRRTFGSFNRSKVIIPASTESSEEPEQENQEATSTRRTYTGINRLRTTTEAAETLEVKETDTKLENQNENGLDRSTSIIEMSTKSGGLEESPNNNEASTNTNLLTTVEPSVILGEETATTLEDENEGFTVTEFSTASFELKEDSTEEPVDQGNSSNVSGVSITSTEVIPKETVTELDSAKAQEESTTSEESQTELSNEESTASTESSNVEEDLTTTPTARGPSTRRYGSRTTTTESPSEEDLLSTTRRTPAVISRARTRTTTISAQSADEEDEDSNKTDQRYQRPLIGINIIRTTTDATPTRRPFTPINVLRATSSTTSPEEETEKETEDQLENEITPRPSLSRGRFSSTRQESESNSQRQSFSRTRYQFPSRQNNLNRNEASRAQSEASADQDNAEEEFSSEDSKTKVIPNLEENTEGGEEIIDDEEEDHTPRNIVSLLNRSRSRTTKTPARAPISVDENHRLEVEEKPKPTLLQLRDRVKSSQFDSIDDGVVSTRLQQINANRRPSNLTSIYAYLTNQTSTNFTVDSNVGRTQTNTLSLTDANANDDESKELGQDQHSEPEDSIIETNPSLSTNSPNLNRRFQRVQFNRTAARRRPSATTVPPTPIIRTRTRTRPTARAQANVSLTDVDSTSTLNLTTTETGSTENVEIDAASPQPRRRFRVLKFKRPLIANNSLSLEINNSTNTTTSSTDSVDNLSLGLELDLTTNITTPSPSTTPTRRFRKVIRKLRPVGNVTVSNEGASSSNDTEKPLNIVELINELSENESTTPTILTTVFEEDEDEGVTLMDGVNLNATEETTSSSISNETILSDLPETNVTSEISTTDTSTTTANPRRLLISRRPYRPTKPSINAITSTESSSIATPRTYVRKFNRNFKAIRPPSDAANGIGFIQQSSTRPLTGFQGRNRFNFPTRTSITPQAEEEVEEEDDEEEDGDEETNVEEVEQPKIISSQIEAQPAKEENKDEDEEDEDEVDNELVAEIDEDDTDDEDEEEDEEDEEKEKDEKEEVKPPPPPTAPTSKRPSNRPSFNRPINTPFAPNRTRTGPAGPVPVNRFALDRRPSNKPRVINRPTLITLPPNLIDTDNKPVVPTSITPPSVFIPTNTRSYERKYSASSTETTPQDQSNPLLEDLNIDALNARNKKIFEVNSKKHTTTKPKLIQNQPQPTSDTTDTPNNSLDTSTIFDDEDNNLINSQDDAMVTTTEGVTEQPASAIEGQLISYSPKQKIITISRVVEINSKEDKLRRKSKNDELKTVESTQLRSEGVPTLEALGEISRVKYVHLVDGSAVLVDGRSSVADYTPTESSYFVRNTIPEVEPDSLENTRIEYEYGSTSAPVRNTIPDGGFSNGLLETSRNSKAITVPEVIADVVEASTISLQGLFDSGRQAKKIDSISNEVNGIVYAYSLGEVPTTPRNEKPTVSSTTYPSTPLTESPSTTKVTTTPTPPEPTSTTTMSTSTTTTTTTEATTTTTTTTALPTTIIEETAESAIESTTVSSPIPSTTNRTYTRPIVPLLRPESNESPLVRTGTTTITVRRPVVRRRLYTTAQPAAGTSNDELNAEGASTTISTINTNDEASAAAVASTSSTTSLFKYNRRTRPNYLTTISAKLRPTPRVLSSSSSALNPGEISTTTGSAAASSNDITFITVNKLSNQKFPSGVKRRKLIRPLNANKSTIVNQVDPPRTQNPLFKRRFPPTTTAAQVPTTVPTILEFNTSPLFLDTTIPEDLDQIAKSSIQETKFFHNQIGDNLNEPYHSPELPISTSVLSSTTPRYSSTYDEPITRRVGIAYSSTRRQSFRVPQKTTPIPKNMEIFISRRRPHKTPAPFNKIIETPNPGRTYKPVIDYDYYDDGDERVVDKPTASQVKVVLHGKGIIECLDQGNFPHPLSCRKFISCAKFETGGVVGWEYTCPKGLSYDPVGGMCNWAAGLGCKD